MLLLPLLLLAVIVPGGDSKDAFQGPTSYHVIQILTFANSTWPQGQSSGWLDDFQIHGWDSDSGTATFLKPWSKGNFSDEEIIELEGLFQAYFIGFTKKVQEYVSKVQIEYPFVIQCIAGCKLHSGKSIGSFLRAALGGLDFASIKNHSCAPAPEGGSRAQQFCALVSQYKDIWDIIETLLSETCPRFLLGVLDAGKAELQRQVKPEAWLSSDPSPGPGRLLLVCHVSGFYPKPVWVMWMRGEQKQSGTQRGDTVPNADGTWYLRVTLHVTAGEETGLSCRVKHSSLGDQDIIIYWGHSTSVSLILLAILVPSLVLLICLALWFLRRWSFQNIS
ncbi:T-cell surface glycoprotein CD1b isoform X2 [Neophocaena asiaeorientalis asiaeorientalis]|uniref:T-cell surface glycoprotein CD1b isoform X2 n=1 Tax=Neophocaena asiaeorientalis asiaeorientalis TaxID=1706337 RepID=A0A341BX74_NEOAA|nr:T-cell surface glycoprotein CD1b isoform X2 [Neophocaena asiaeorientalis asiaeorientalis]